ncbi:MAG TPA: hypothetical protein VIY27_06750 [Myxococcota bacterium]
MADLHIQSFPGNYEEVEEFNGLPRLDRGAVWELVRAEDWPTLSDWMLELGVIDPGEYVRKARLLREALPGGDVDRLWIRVTRPR